MKFADWLIDTWGTLASAVGLLVSIVGFLFAIRQIVRSRKAAEAAERAVLETKKALARNLTNEALLRASQQIDFVKNLHLDREWRRAIDRYPEIRHGLAAVQSQYSGLSDEEKSTIQNTIMELAKL